MNIDDMLLSDKEKAQLVKDAQTWGWDWAQRRSRSLKVHIYVGLYLDRTNGGRATPFNCYTEGTDTYARKDAQAMTEEDVQAILESSQGQGSKVRGKAGDLQVVHEWFVDSSD